MNDNNALPTKESCTSCNEGGFNYCLFGKVLVSIPLFTMIAYFSYLTFHNPLLQILGAFAGMFIAYRVNVWLDNIPFLQKKYRVLPTFKKD
jgi:hypothetical protein